MAVDINDKDFLLKVKSKDEAAFGELYAYFFKSLCAFAIRYTKSNEIAEEMVQEVFLKLWEMDIDRMEKINDIKRFIYRAVINNCLNYLNHQKVVRNHQEAILAFKNDSYLMDFIDREEQKLAADRVLSILPEQCRKVFLLSRFDGMSHKEIAEHLNISPKTVNNHIYKALSEIREFIKQNNKDIFLIMALIKLIKIETD